MQTKHVAIAASLILVVLLPIAVLGAPGDLAVEEAGLGSDCQTASDQPGARRRPAGEYRPVLRNPAV